MGSALLSPREEVRIPGNTKLSTHSKKANPVRNGTIPVAPETPRKVLVPCQNLSFPVSRKRALICDGTLRTNAFECWKHSSFQHLNFLELSVPEGHFCATPNKKILATLRGVNEVSTDANPQEEPLDSKKSMETSVQHKTVWGYFFQRQRQKQNCCVRRQRAYLCHERLELSRKTTIVTHRRVKTVQRIIESESLESVRRGPKSQGPEHRATAEMWKIPR